MLTFTFTGVDGTMSECETLTSGMVGKEIQLIFDDSWTDLTKTVVFRAGDLNRVVMNASSTVTIPEEVLARPFGKLFVGVYGTDAAGTIVIPTIMAEGPMIRYGADPMEDETAAELPVWKNLQNQIGNLSGLATEEKDNLVAAVNELHSEGAELSSAILEIQEKLPFIGEPEQLETDDKSTLVAAINELHSEGAELSSAVLEIQEKLPFIGEPEQLETDDKSTLVAAVNELHSQLNDLAEACVGLTPAAAQLLVDILSQGTYNTDQAENIAALAGELGAEAPEAESSPILYWDFRTGSLVDQIAGMEATSSADVTLDAAGAHIDTKSSYILLPAGLDGATLSGNVLEVKFGQMTLDPDVSVLRLALSCSGSQPATMGLQWINKGCWSSGVATVTEFTDRNMFSGKTLIAKGAPDSNQIDWYCEEQLICTTTPSSAHSHISLGSTMNGAFPVTVEYVKIYPDA